MNEGFTYSTLLDLYHGQGKTTKQIAQQCHRSQETIRSLLHNFDIEIKDSYKRIASLRPPKEVLEELYLQKHQSTVQISTKFNTTPRSVLDWLKSYDIPRRTLSEAAKLREPTKGRTIRLKKRKVSYQGYVFVYDPHHPRADHNGYVREHILVWERFHNKSLPTGWVVHHLNGIKSDNRPENLVAMTKARHIDQAAPYKKRIRQLEIEIEQLRHALANNQLTFFLGEN